jgi:hypothetical protein
MTIQQQQEALNNALRHFKFPKEYIIQSTFAGRANKFQIASKIDQYGYNTHTNLMTYEEMNAYLMGYNKAITKPLN